MGIVITLFGFYAIVGGAYRKFYAKPLPNPKKWGRTIAKVEDFEIYETRNISKYQYEAFTSHSETPITYTVDSVEYKKYLSGVEPKNVHIFYKKKNPSVFRTTDEVRNLYSSSKRTTSFISAAILGVVALVVGIVLIVLYFTTMSNYNNVI